MLASSAAVKDKEKDSHSMSLKEKDNLMKLKDGKDIKDNGRVVHKKNSKSRSSASSKENKKDVTAAIVEA